MVLIMDKDKKCTIDRFLNHTLEIIFLLTGEEYVIVKKNTDKSSIELRTGEVPIKCDDIAVYFSMEEWEYIEGHKDLYKDVMMEDPKTPKVSGTPADKCSDYQGKNQDSSTILNEAKNISENVRRKSVEMNSESYDAGLQAENQDSVSINVQEKVVHQMKIHQDVSLGFEDENSEIILIKDQEEEIRGEKDIQLLDFQSGAYEEDEASDLILINDQGVDVRDEKNVPAIEVHSDSYTVGFKTGIPLMTEELYAKGYLEPQTTEVHEDSNPDSPMSGNNLEESPITVISSDEMMEKDSKLFHDFQSQESTSNQHKTPTSLPAGTLSPAYMYRPCEPNQHAFNKTFLKGANEAAVGGAMAFDTETFHGNAHIHTDENVNKCLQCGKIYLYKCSLVVHQRKHMEKKSHQCLECGKDFTYRSSLVKHRKTHTGEKAFKCDECGKRFAVKYNLIQHRRTHTGEKPHKCNVCGRQFAYKSAFNQHLRTHTKEKPHLCHECGKCFTRKTNLVKHQRVHERSQLYIL